MLPMLTAKSLFHSNMFNLSADGARNFSPASMLSPAPNCWPIRDAPARSGNWERPPNRWRWISTIRARPAHISGRRHGESAGERWGSGQRLRSGSLNQRVEFRRRHKLRDQLQKRRTLLDLRRSLVQLGYGWIPLQQAGMQQERRHL